MNLTAYSYSYIVVDQAKRNGMTTSFHQRTDRMTTSFHQRTDQMSTSRYYLILLLFFFNYCCLPREVDTCSRFSKESEPQSGEYYSIDYKLIATRSYATDLYSGALVSYVRIL